MTLTDVIREYEQSQRNRALGGLRALSGFDFQLRCHLAEFVEHLVSNDGILESGQDFAQGLEALSDFTTNSRDELVCVQAKRTLTTTAMAQAAVEFATIAEFLQTSSIAGAAELHPRFRVVGNRSELSDDWNWEAVKLPAKERPELQLVWRSLVDDRRLDPPQVENDPWWRVIAATFHLLDRPFEFAREALDLCLRRHKSSAEQVRDEIAEHFRRHSRKPDGLRAVTEADFERDAVDRLNPLLVGKQPSLELVRNHQFMLRTEHVQNAIQSLKGVVERQQHAKDGRLPVLWISGKSGSGKSVLLLQVLESLVKSGLSAVWLKNDARHVVPLLQAFCEERDANNTEFPSFIFVDDLYSPENQQRIDLPELERVISTRPFDRWPVVVSCGPPEFYDRLDQESSGSTLYLQSWSLPLVELQPTAVGVRAEADFFTEWFQKRTGERPQRGSAFSGDHGLMISMAFELRFEQDASTLKPFARRFRDRLAAECLDQKLILPLALNRLYLLAPTAWLEEADRERLEAINREKDFALLDLGGDGEYLRLTHPHISDAIYCAIRKSPSPRAFANDLAEALRRAMAGNVTTLRLLLRALSSSDPLIVNRLADVDLDHLAEHVTADWKQSDVESRLRMSELADVKSSWACWHGLRPDLRLEQRLGRSLLAEARAVLRNAGNGWSRLWQRLEAAFPGDGDLLTDAAEWLGSQTDHGGWSHVWERSLESQVLPTGINRDELLRRGFKWLEGREDRNEWAFVFEKLLESLQLPITVAREDLVTRGVDWLDGRADHVGWSFLWQRLILSVQETMEVDRCRLIRLGREWLLQLKNRQRPEWDKVLEKWIKAGGHDAELFVAAADWIMENRNEKQFPSIAVKLLRAAQEPERFDCVAQALADWCCANANEARSRFVVGYLRTALEEGWSISCDAPGWKMLHAWMAPTVRRADDATAARLLQMRVSKQRVVGRITQPFEKGFVVALDDPEITAYLPRSQAELYGPADSNDCVGFEGEFEIKSVSQGHTGWMVVVSRRNILRAEKSDRAETRLRELHEGDRVIGTVKSVVEFGAFIDLEGVDGLLHLSDMSWQRPIAPDGYCVVGQQLELVVLSIDLPKRKLALGLKQLTTNPWEIIAPTLVVGSDIDGIVTNLEKYGAFIEIAPGLIGLLHLSNLFWIKRPSHPKECLEIGQRLRCQILRVDIENQKIELGLKQLTSNPWTDRIARQYVTGKWVEGRVARLAIFGLFVELEPDLQGLLHLTEIPYARANPKRLAQHFEIGQTLRVRILRVDVNEQKISLSLQPN